MARSRAKLAHVADTVNHAGGKALVVPGNVALPDDCRQVVEKTVNKFGRLDALVNNAATLAPMANTAVADPETWHEALEVNLLGPFQMCRYALNHLRKQEGRIVNISSGAAKTALAAAVRPGVVDTQMQLALRQSGPQVMPQAQAAYYLELKKQGLLEPPHVPARSIAWLALHAPGSFSGRFLDYDDPDIAGPALEMLGEAP